MKYNNILLSTVSKALRWAQSGSLWYYIVRGGCCADEVINAFGNRYDIERLGCLPQLDPHQADLLIVCGGISKKAAPALKKIYDSMVSPQYVIAVGACACGGGPYHSSQGYSYLSGINQRIPVDVFVPGCPPRPEAIMNGIISLQEKMSEDAKTWPTNQ